MIFASVAGLLVKLGLGQQTANRAAPYVFALSLLAAAGTGFTLWLHFHDARVVERHVTAANNQTLGRTIKANEAAAAEQLADQKILSDLQRSYADALNNPPPGASPDPRKRLDCQRLLRAGYREADLPASCGYAGSGGTGTPPHP